MLHNPIIPMHKLMGMLMIGGRQGGSGSSAYHWWRIRWFRKLYISVKLLSMRCTVTSLLATVHHLLGLRLSMVMVKRIISETNMANANKSRLLPNLSCHDPIRSCNVVWFVNSYGNSRKTNEWDLHMEEKDYKLQKLFCTLKDKSNLNTL